MTPGDPRSGSAPCRAGRRAPRRRTVMFTCRCKNPCKRTQNSSKNPAICEFLPRARHFSLFSPTVCVIHLSKFNFPRGGSLIHWGSLPDHPWRGDCCSAVPVKQREQRNQVSLEGVHENPHSCGPAWPAAGCLFLPVVRGTRTPARTRAGTCVVHSLPSFVAQGEFENTATVGDVITVSCDPTVYGTESKIKFTAAQLYTRCKNRLGGSSRTRTRAPRGAA